MQCQEHKDYKGITYPSYGCSACNDVYLFELGMRVDAMATNMEALINWVERLAEKTE